MAKIRIPTVNEKLLQRYIRHAVYLEQLKMGEAKLISRFLKQKIFPQIYKKLIDELGRVENLSTLGSINKIPAQRLKRMLAATQKISTAGMVKAENVLVDRLVNISKFEADWNKDLISKTVPIDIDMAMPSSEVLKNLVTMRPMDGKKLRTWMKGYSTAVRIAMTKQIKVGIATGESLPAIGARINKALNFKGKQAEYIARTAVSNVVHQAKEEVFKKNMDIIRKVQWISTLDDRTSMECIGYDGRIFDVGDGPRPPIHFNCRSTVIPITPSWQEFGIIDPPPATRASMNGAVPDKMTYKQWLKTQPKSVQVKVLGKKRAELYDSGKGLSIDKFVGKDMKPLTLKQIAKREGIDLAPAPPMQVKAIPTKGTGLKLTSSDEKILKDWSFNNHINVVKAQLGESLRSDMPLPSISDALVEANKVEKILKKMNGYNGTSYRGLAFRNESKRTAFLQQFKKGSIWNSKSFQSTSADERIAEGFSKGLVPELANKKGVILQIKGKSGRDIAEYSGIGRIEKEILFKAGTPFKVDKIVGNKVYLTEITKQAQLKSAPPVTASKVRITTTKTTSKEFNKIINDTIDSYPEKIKKALNDSRVSYTNGSKITEVYPRLAGKHPRGWSEGATWDSSGGMFNINTKTITISETKYSAKLKKFDKPSKTMLKYTINHETGHGFNHSVKVSYSDSEFFKAAYKKDIAKLTPNDITKNDLKYFLQEGSAGRDETFADLFSELMGQGQQALTVGNKLKQFFPESTKYIEDLLK